MSYFRIRSKLPLGKEGVLRVGGIVSDYTRYEPEGTIKASPKDTVITRASLEQFALFLSTVGWKAIWSLNFAQGALVEAVEEARSVADVLGNRLLCLELGNEVEAYQNHEKPFREPPYPYEVYRAEFNQWHAAISKAVPGANFAALTSGSWYLHFHPDTTNTATITGRPCSWWKCRY